MITSEHLGRLAHHLLERSKGELMNNDGEYIYFVVISLRSSLQSLQSVYTARKHKKRGMTGIQSKERPALLTLSHKERRMGVAVKCLMLLFRRAKPLPVTRAALFLTAVEVLSQPDKFSDTTSLQFFFHQYLKHYLDNMAEADNDTSCNDCIRVDKWDGCAVKNTLDDAVKTILIEKYDNKEHHRLMDIRLGICLTSVAAAMFALLWDYLHPFPESKPVLVGCVISYFILMGILTAYTTMVEKGIFLEAVTPDNGKWTAASDMKRFDDKYTLCIELTRAGTSKEEEITKSVSHWFTEDGDMLYSKFENEVSRMIDSLVKDKKNK